MATRTVLVFEPDFQLREEEEEEEESLKLYIHVRSRSLVYGLRRNTGRMMFGSLLALYLLCDMTPNSSLLYQELKFTLSLHRL